MYINIWLYSLGVDCGVNCIPTVEYSPCDVYISL